MKKLYALFTFLAFIFLAEKQAVAVCPVTITAGGPVVFCIPDSVVLTATSGTGYLYQWKKGNVAIPGATAQTYTAKTTGYFTVTVTVVSPACSSTSNNIYVSAEAPLVVTITHGGSTLCGASTDILNAPYGSSFFYQWFEDTVILPNTNSYQLNTGHNGTYSCTITNTCGIYSSAPFVLNDPWLAANPYGVITPDGPTSFCSGASVTLSESTASFSGYQWYRDGVLIPGATNSSYTATLAGNYVLRITEYCWIWSTYMDFYSNIITVTILPGSFPTASITAAGPTDFCTGGSVTLNAATGAGWSFQWNFNGIDIPGATSASYVANATGFYACLVSNSCGNVWSNTISVHVIPVSVTINVAGPTTICNGTTATLTSSGAGFGGTYQWKLNGSNIVGATAVNYLAPAQGSYTLEITNMCGTFTSNAINIVISGTCSTGLKFDGSNDYAKIPHHVATDFGTGNFTIEAWFNLEINQSSYFPTLISNRPSFGNGIWVNFSSGRLNVTLNGVGIIAGPDLRDNACHHFAVSRASLNSTSVYLDGALLGTFTATTSSVTTGTNTYISYDLPYAPYGNGYSPMNGRVMEVRMWNISRTQTEVQNTMNSQLTGSETGLAGYWRLDDGTGQVINDYSPTNNDGQLGSTASTDINDPVFISTCALSGCPLPPSSISAGGPTTFCTGGSVTLNANTGAGLSYQWKLNGVNIPGATLSSYVATSAGNYSCVVTSTCGSSTSNIILVIVNSAPTATITAGGNTAFCAGGSVTLTVNFVSGSTFQWKLNTVNIPGATTISYVATATGNYTCTITNSCGSTTSNIITVTVNALPPATITAGGSTTICSGNSVLLSANTGAGLSYQWKNGGSNIPGAVTANYSATTAGSYTCVVSNASCSATSNSIVVTVIPAPPATITAGGSTTFCAGGFVNLNANTGTGLSYQWKLNGGNIAGATSSSYAATASGNYTCTVTSSCGSVTSNTITVNVLTNCQGGLRFDGVNDRVTIADQSVYAIGSGDFTVEAWIQADVSQNSTYPIILSKRTTDQSGFIVYLATGQLALQVGGMNLARAGIDLRDNACHHIAINRSGGTVNYFIDGALISTRAGFGQNISDTHPVWIGNDQPNPNPFEGIIHEVRFWNLARTQAQIQSVNDTFLTGTEPGLIAYWRMNDGGNQVVNDYSNTNNDGQLGSTATVDVSDPSTVSACSLTGCSLPNAAITAGGPTTICTGGSVLLNANTGTGLSYQWKLNGVAIPAATTSSYNAGTSGEYTCVVTNACAGVTSNGIQVTVLSVPSTPGTITGLASGICGNTTSYSIAPVAGASLYTWTVPAGVIINSGQGTTSLNVTFPIPFSSGSISVNAGNICGTSSTNTLALTSALNAPALILGVTEVCVNSTYVYSISPVAGATYYNWSVPPKARIVHGQGTTTVEVRIQKYGGNIGVFASNACTTSAPAILPVSITTINCTHGHRTSGILDAEVFPNPSSSIFTMKVFSAEDSKCILVVRDVTGRELERRENISPGESIQFGKEFSNGIYFAELIQGEERIVLKVVKSD